jgi:hypothetical protein
MLFNPVYQSRIEASARAGEFRELERRFDADYQDRRQAALDLAGARKASDASRLGSARTAFVNADGRLKPGLPADARVLVTDR